MVVRAVVVLLLSWMAGCGVGCFDRGGGRRPGGWRVCVVLCHVNFPRIFWCVSNLSGILVVANLLDEPNEMVFA